MDMTSCVGRRTRSRTESYLNDLLNRSKGISSAADQSKSRKGRQRKRGVPLRDDSCSPKRRRKKKSKDDDDVEFVGTIYPKGKREKEDDNNVGSPSVIALSSESDRACGEEKPCDDNGYVEFVRTIYPEVDDVDLIGEKKSHDGDVDDDDDVVFLGTLPRDQEHVDDLMVEEKRHDDVVFLGTLPREQEDVDRACDLGVDDANLMGEEKISATGDEVMSLRSSSDDEEAYIEYLGTEVCSEDDDSDQSDSSDYTFNCSEDDEFVGATHTATVKKKSRSKRVCSQGKRKTSEKVHEQRKRRRFRREKKKKHWNVVDLLGDSFRGLDESFDVGENPWVSPPLNLRFGCEESEPVEKTEEEKEIDRLWQDMALALSLEGVHSSTYFKDGDVSCSNGKHDFVLDEEIGMKCRYCSYVSVEMKDVSPAMDKYRAYVNNNDKYRDYDKKTCRNKKGDPLLDSLDLEASDHNSNVASLKNIKGTVWEYIPGIKDTLYPHQQEGFEFMWKNLAGTTKLDELKSSVVKESGGCIISHAPGTGKTRLTIVFLQSYLEQFPDSHPVVIAPASLLLTWEEEFKKWNSNIPFYNMSNQELSGQENPSAKGNKHNRGNKDSVRMVKLCSWRNKKSILGISYSLYEKLAGKKRAAGETQKVRKMLLDMPGLLVLDEGHTPRNHNSCIWKVLTEVKTEKRIILSGTPFQNNFKELSNVLCLTRPAYTEKISSRLHDLTRLSQEGKNGRFDEEIGIAELKDMIAPFVHVHKGNILRESLPGLRDCVVVLNAPFQQEKILKRIDHSQNTLELEHKLSAVSVHPSLYLGRKQTNKERLTIGPLILKSLESLTLDSKEGAKTRFLIDFIRFSETVKEKVLVFSQHLDTLELIRDQLNAVFGWTEGEEILYMHGQLQQKFRQRLINNFNKPDSKSKVLLASTGACSEGINLVGASRVVLLDVVWNPSVERQAISRAYRIGQKRVVYTYHLMVKGTTEWDKYCKQNKKHRISEMVFTPTNEEDKLIENEVVSEDKILDEMVRHEKLKDMFGKILYRKKESDMFTNIL
ncbi:SNF2 domain-containing protein CLASSY 4 [Raphanus sativus]|uniref:SNF2 domain-containing protein CLASSY 4 isoform X2 n=1 Tax=Raphanus sativus TaxID=3726 RepID=A0A6J0P3Z4_RAPSA|nr:SNF2 domain-containing protein CLASSY 4 isoform X2 [Raphanus sativus]KAJ4897683.1 SNF2 domain-containing protein CLASSY 4 [Raphanus sativus]